MSRLAGVCESADSQTDNVDRHVMNETRKGNALTSKLSKMSHKLVLDSPPPVCLRPLVEQQECWMVLGLHSL